MTDRSTAKPLAMMQPLCQAIREGRKTVTRRMIRNPEYYGCPTGDCPHEKQSECDQAMNSLCRKEIGFAVGEIRYLTETHWAFGHWDHVQKKGRMGWQFVCDRPDDIRFEAPNCALASIDKADPGIPTWYKRNARFMPRAYARTFIGVKDVRVERLQDITEADARAEGLTWTEPTEDDYQWERYHWLVDYGSMDQFVSSMKGVWIVHGVKIDFSDIWGCNAVQGFQFLWNSLHLGPHENWTANPWVARIEFERIEI